MVLAPNIRRLSPPSNLCGCLASFRAGATDVSQFVITRGLAVNH
jgi:hypothetical protein